LCYVDFKRLTFSNPSSTGDLPLGVMGLFQADIRQSISGKENHDFLCSATSYLAALALKHKALRTVESATTVAIGVP
jgi:hypothetical protein